MTIIPIGNITPNGNNRKNGGELTLIPSVKTDGILEPVIVYKEEGDEKFRIAAGHRRYASAKAYGIEDIPCIVLPKEKAIRAASIENLDRENLTPADVAESILSMHACGYSNNEISLITKHTKNQVARIIKLEDCIPEVRESLRKGDISLEIALEYAPYSKDIQKDVYKNFSKATWFKANDIRNALNRRLGNPLKECSDLFFRSTLGCGVSCLSCEKNLACNGVLFSEGVTKEESVCTSKEDWLRKYTELAKSLGLRYQDVEGLKDYGYAEEYLGFAGQIAGAYLESMQEIPECKLLVLPESALIDYDPAHQETLSQIAQDRNCYILAGMLVEEEGQRYNCAVLFPPDQAGSAVKYRKRNLVPFVEGGTLESGTQSQTMHVDGLYLLPLICFDTMYPSSYQSKEVVDLAVAISSDVFAEGTSLARCHQSYGVFYARTFRLPLAQVTQNGATLCVHSHGGLEEVATPYQQVQGVLELQIGE